MKYKRYQITYLALLLGLGMVCGVVRAEPPHAYPFGNYDAAVARAAKSNKKIFLYYGRQGCGFCDMTNKNSFSKDSVKQRYLKNYELVYLDAEGGGRLTLANGERITEQQFGARFKVLGTPYFVFFEPDGTLIYKAPGFKTEKDLIQMDEYIQGKHYKNKSFNDFSKEQKL